jgi:hypothetical protein
MILFKLKLLLKKVLVSISSNHLKKGEVMSVATGARTSFEQFILDRQKQLSGGNKHYVITPEEYNKAAVEFFGKIEDTLPEGAKVTRQISPLEVEYTMPDGKTYKAFRNTDSNLGINTGKVETTQLGSLIDKQSGAGEQDLVKQILPQLFPGLNVAGQTNTGQVPGRQTATDALGLTPNSPTATDNSDVGTWLDKLMANANQLGGTKGFVPIDATTQQYLDTINQNTQGQLNQQFTDQSGKLVADLYGKGINKSNLAGTQANRLLQGQGLVQAQAQSDAANRALSVMQYLTQAQQGNLALAGEEYGQGGQQATANRNSNLGFATNLLNQALQREVSGTQLSQSEQQISNQQSQFEQQYGLARDQFEAQAATQRRAAHLQLISSILGGVLGVGSSLIGGGALKGLGSIFGGAGNGGPPPIGGDGGYG